MPTSSKKINMQGPTIVLTSSRSKPKKQVHFGPMAVNKPLPPTPGKENGRGFLYIPPAPANATATTKIRPGQAQKTTTVPPSKKGSIGGISLGEFNWAVYEPKSPAGYRPLAAQKQASFVAPPTPKENPYHLNIRRSHQRASPLDGQRVPTSADFAPQTMRFTDAFLQVEMHLDALSNMHGRNAPEPRTPTTAGMYSVPSIYSQPSARDSGYSSASSSSTGTADTHYTSSTTSTSSSKGGPFNLEFRRSLRISIPKVIPRSGAPVPGADTPITSPESASWRRFQVMDTATGNVMCYDDDAQVWSPESKKVLHRKGESQDIPRRPAYVKGHGQSASTSGWI